MLTFTLSALLLDLYIIKSTLVCFTLSAPLWGLYKVVESFACIFSPIAEQHYQEQKTHAVFQVTLCPLSSKPIL